MTILTVKTQAGGGYLVNGNMSVPNDPANRHYVMVQEWRAEGNTPAPEFTALEIEANIQQGINDEAQAYLSKTDWYITRHAETAVAVPADVTTARAEARESIV